MLGDSTIIAAIIGAAAAIAAAMIPIVLKRRKRSDARDTGDKGAGRSAESVTVTTSGDQSPGLVQGNYVINQTIVNEYKEARGKRWREISVGKWSIQSDIKDRQKLWLHNVCEALLTTFGDEYQDFVFLFSVYDVDLEGVPAKVYQMLSHKAAFTGTVVNLRMAHVQKLIAAGDAADPDAAKAKLIEELQQAEDPLKSWTVVPNIVESGDLTPVRCIYEPEFKRITLESVAEGSLNPVNYPDHLSRTSECLIFVAAALQAVVSYMGDTAWYANHYSLQKMAVDLLDTGRIDFDRLRVNMDDDEDWDYVNPEYDAEVGRYSQ